MKPIALKKAVLKIALLVAALAIVPVAYAGSKYDEICVVSQDKFGGEMGEPVVVEHNGRSVKLCCKSCIRKFKKDPEKYIKLLDEAAKK